MLAKPITEKEIEEYGKDVSKCTAEGLASITHWNLITITETLFTSVMSKAYSDAKSGNYSCSYTFTIKKAKNIDDMVSIVEKRLKEQGFSDVKGCFIQDDGKDVTYKIEFNWYPKEKQ